MIQIINEAVITPSKSLLTAEFRRGYKNLSPQVQAIAELKYIRWRLVPSSLNFEPKFFNVYVIEITRDFHAICQVDGTIVRWLWIGNYKNYTARLDALRKK